MVDNVNNAIRTPLHSILDDVTIIGLSVEVFEKHYQQFMDDEAKQYLEKIKKHCNHIVATINENNALIK
jgi:hypothetical protein